jgi:putative Mn2+ efflux pump MntP
VLVLAVSADAFFSAFAYGTRKTRIPFSSVLVISAVCSAFLAVSLYAGELIRPFFPENIAKLLCFLILFVLGLIKLFDKGNTADHDRDHNMLISPAEAVSLSVALSLDGLAAGIGTALGGANKPLIIALSLAVGIAAITLGCLLGNKTARKSKMSFSWLGGAGLILLAVYKLL